MLLLWPDADVFQQMHSIWQLGRYPSRRLFVENTHVGAGQRERLIYGDDEQQFLAHAFVGHKHPIHGRGTRAHRLDRCHNDKAGKLRCDPRRAVYYHKVPLWEAQREEALWRAVLAGRCLANPELLNWRYPPTRPRRARSTAGTRGGGAPRTGTSAILLPKAVAAAEVNPIDQKPSVSHSEEPQPPDGASISSLRQLLALAFPQPSGREPAGQPPGQPPGQPHDALARRLLRAGFTLRVLQSAVAEGSLQDVVAALSLEPSLGLRPGERLALAAAVRMSVRPSGRAAV